MLIEAYPDSVRSATHIGNMPLHCLCKNIRVDEAAAIQILNFLLEKCPEAVRHANNRGNLPIHLASWGRSLELCRLLIDAYPGSERMTDANGMLPLHRACVKGSLATVEYLYGRYPEAINHAETGGYYPIHAAILGTRFNSLAAAPDVVQFLLDCDPNQTLKKFQGQSLLHFACWKPYNDSNIEVGIQMIKFIFDAYPEAIEDNMIATDIHRYHQRVQALYITEIL